MNDGLFSSNAEEIKFYIAEMLSDGEIHNRDKIREYVIEHFHDRNILTEGMFTGALRSLVESSQGAYIIPQRGKYQKKIHNNIESQTKQLIDETIAKLNIICTQNVLELNENDIQSIHKNRKLLEMLNEFKNTL
ncbi:MAG: hypothetical protein K2P09_07005 [Erysipelotrichales bacterium]|nr:hypothetical protein [Erysipelotrichales bacterium]